MSYILPSLMCYLEKILLRETPSGGPLRRHGGGGIGGWERPEVFLFCSGDPLTVW